MNSETIQPHAESESALRICSLLPSATEIAFALGLQNRLKAVTHECDFPPEARSLPAITSSLFEEEDGSSDRIHQHVSDAVHSGSSIYRLDAEMLRQLQPNLILTQELCDVCAVSYRDVSDAVRILEGDCRVVSLEPTTLEEIVQTIETVGSLTGRRARASELSASLRRRIKDVEARTQAAADRPRVLALEWLDPPFVGGHWVPEMIRRAGGVDPFGAQGRPSFQIEWDRILRNPPDVIVLMPCGFDLERTVRRSSDLKAPAKWRNMSAVQTNRIFAVDGSSYFNRPGPRIVDGLEILAEILHPELFPQTRRDSAWKPLTVA